MRFLITGLGVWATILCAMAQPEAKPDLPSEVPARPPVAEPVTAPAAKPVAPMPSDLVATSRTKQFRISGGNEMGRGLCVMLSERAKEEFLRLIEQGDDWKIPISVVLHGEPGDKPPATSFVTRLNVIEGVYHLKLDMHLAKGLRVERFKQVITEMLIYERALRALSLVDDAMVLSVPPWLSVGLREASAWRMQLSDRRLYAAMFKQDGTYRVDDLLTVDRGDYLQLDEASRVAFRVSAGSLVMALLEQPDGRKAFREFLSEAAAFEGEMSILMQRHFPELNLSPNSLAKWWALQLANQGGLNLLTDVMTVAETEEQLARALFLELPPLSDGAANGEESVSSRRVGLDQWALLDEMEATDRIAAVRPAQAALVHLSYRCFPSYRPLLVDYQKQLVRLSQGQSESVMQSLTQLEQARQIMKSKTERGRDYLDWFEITRARKTSGVFDDYLKLKQQLKQQDHNRKDGMSLYLDRMEELFERGKED